MLAERAPAPAPAVVRLRRVERAYRSAGTVAPVLRGIDMELEGRSLNVILGASGCGKTTLLNILGGIDRVDAGEAWVCGTPLHEARGAALVRFRRLCIGFVFQFYNLMPTLTALENVETAVEHLGLSPRARADRAAELLDAVGLADHRGKFPAQLSGGEQQRVAVARALVRKPPLLLCDEPTGNLDQESGAQVVELIDRLRKESGSTVVVVTHNPELFARPDRVLRMRDGRLAP